MRVNSDSDGEGEMKIKDVTELEVFKYAHQLTLEIYKVTNNFPKEETYGLVSQMRRSAASICANLACPVE
ncbi:four helix bundle protein [Deferribacter autotrophicus]|nr:four helix bundle protein [Deferribacter autotrophicus]